MRSMAFIVVGFIGIAFVGGCGGYATPGGASDFASIADARDKQTEHGVGETLQLAPLAQLPTTIAVVRIGGSAYSSPGEWSDGSSRVSVVNVRDVERPEALDRLGALPMVTGIAPISSIMLPRDVCCGDLRRAAAQLHADMLLVYGLSSETHIDDALAPLSFVTLGLSPNEVADAHCTASAVLLDTRNGYVYATMEASDRQQQLASAWTSEPATNFACSRAEQGAFDKLTAQIAATWPKVVKQMQAPKPAADHAPE